jgi:hypothetical protein
MSRQMLSSKEPLSAPRLGAGMFPGHEDALRLFPTAGIARSCQRVNNTEILHDAMSKLEYTDENKGRDTLKSEDVWMNRLR